MTSLHDQVQKICRFNHDHVPHLGFFDTSKAAPPLPRKDVLKLYLAFRSAHGWGLERCFNSWAVEQPWRQLMPLTFFERLRFNMIHESVHL